MDCFAKYRSFISYKPGASSKTADVLSRNSSQVPFDLEAQAELSLAVTDLKFHQDPSMEIVNECIIRKTLERITGDYRERIRKMTRRIIL